MKANEKGTFRGLHLVIINQINFRIEFAKVFDTYTSSHSLNNFIEKDIPKGYIIAVASCDDIVTKMSGKVKNWFKRMGSMEIYELKYRQGFAFISKIDPDPEIRYEKCNEKRSTIKNRRVSVAQVYSGDPEIQDIPDDERALAEDAPLWQIWSSE